jgi:hypothetical protein
MGSDKIFMFDNPAAGESAGIMSMIPALLQNKGLDPNMVAALMSNKNNQDAGVVLVVGGSGLSCSSSCGVVTDSVTGLAMEQTESLLN